MRAKTRTGSGSPTSSRTGRRLLLIALVLAAGVLNAGVAAAEPSTETAGAQEAPASALATCSGNSCNYQDPQATGCSTGAANFDDWIYVGYLVEHRYSPTCRAVWVRATYVSGNAWSFSAYLETRLPGGNVRQYVTWRGDTGWSNMYSSGYLSRIVAVSNTGTYYGDWF
ncbi:DUF2690 domain-containing protein [Micromonospora sp. NPDC049559]|uniref:DUF2690 domain-containing protein n=1 Tax=Micromonospora sp. NPDC049559 TaxID=3155923 RepID=UPI003416F524